MLRMTFLCTMVSLLLLPMAVLQPVAIAQSPRLSTGAPNVTSNPDNTLSISLPLINSGTEAASSAHVTGITLDTSPRLIPRSLPVALGDVEVDQAVRFDMQFDSSRMMPGKKYLLTIRGTYDVGALTLGFTVNSYIEMAQIPLGVAAFSPGRALLNNQVVEFTVLDPSQDASPSSTTIFQGTVANNTGAALNATDLFFNFFGFDPTAISVEQLLGNPDFMLEHGSTSDTVNLFSVRLGPDAVIGQTYAVDVLLQDINGNASSVLTVSIGAIEVTPADLAFIRKTASPDPAMVGIPLTYTLEFVNNGPGTATDITVTDTLPPGVIFVSASGGCSEVGGTVTCNFGNLGSGTHFGPEIVVIPTVVGSITNTARATSTAPDPNPNNNEGIEDTTVIPPHCVGFGSSQLHGNVRTADDRPGTPDVTLTLRGSGDCNDTTTTDALGNYTFPALAVGTYLVTPIKAGCTFVPPALVVALTGANAEVDFRGTCLDPE